MLRLADLSLASVVARVIPLATYYTSINAYVEHYTVYDMGVINHALGAAIREMLRVSHSLYSPGHF